MGQSASAQENRENFRNRDSRRLSRPGHGRHLSSSRSWLSSRPFNHQITPSPMVSISPPPPSDSHASPSIAAFSRQISAQSISGLRGGVMDEGNILTRDDIFYEHHEDRSGYLDDLGVRDAPVTHITASPMPRRSRRIARLSSLITPNYASRALAGDDQQVQREGRFSRRTVSTTNPSRLSSEAASHGARRLSIFGSSRSSVSRLRSRRDLAPISRPFPFNPDASLPPSSFAASPLRENIPLRMQPSTPEISSRFFSVRDRSRLSRIRESISSSVDAFFQALHTSAQRDHGTQSPPQRPIRLTPSFDPEFRLPPLARMEPNLELNESGPDSSLPVDTGLRMSSVPTVSGSLERSIARVDGPSWAERWAERGSTGRREGRRMTQMLRGRSSRLIRRDNDAPLPRILQLAATAIAAQLSGSPEQPLTDMRPVGPEDLDDSLHNLFRTLQNAPERTANSDTRHDVLDTARTTGNMLPQNFFRVFRFVSQGSNITTSAAESASTRERPESLLTANEETEDADGRLVTLVVVGVRSIPSNNDSRGDADATEPSLDSLMSLPILHPSTTLFSQGASGLLRHANGRSRFSSRRRASIGGVTAFPANFDRQRHQRVLSNSSLRDSIGINSNTGNTTPLVVSESPAGPYPPPSTPADPALSTYSSATTTPSRRPSSASAIQYPSLPTRDISLPHLRETGIMTTEGQSMYVQQRRRSDSEFARHRDLGAGASRRNGVVEPDEVDGGDHPVPGSRSWLIYVVGTNLSEDHPALTTPSLFTDNPTYEDMLLLSSLLGPAKTPVASAEDVASASGTFRVQRSSEGLYAIEPQGTDTIQIASHERCLVCLEDYQADDELRRLTKCLHLFHRACIDEWLTTGRNSCPLCRGQGIDEIKEQR